MVVVAAAEETKAESEEKFYEQQTKRLFLLCFVLHFIFVIFLLNEIGTEMISITVLTGESSG